MKRSVQVEIAGQTLAIRSDEGAAYVQALAQHVDAQIQQIGVDKRGGVARERVFLLAALAITDALFRERDLHLRFREGVRARLSAVEAALAEHERRMNQL